MRLSEAPLRDVGDEGPSEIVDGPMRHWFRLGLGQARLFLSGLCDTSIELGLALTPTTVAASTVAKHELAALRIERTRRLQNIHGRIRQRHNVSAAVLGPVLRQL